MLKKEKKCVKLNMDGILSYVKCFVPQSISEKIKNVQSITASHNIYFVLDWFKPKLSSLQNLQSRFLIPNFIKIQSVISEMKHADMAFPSCVHFMYFVQKMHKYNSF
jgi:hypothetical protein